MRIEKTNKVRLWSKYFIILILANVLAGGCLQFYNSTCSLYVDFLGGEASFAGTALTMFTIAATVMRIVAGRTLDRKGRRIVIVIGLAIFAAASVASMIPTLALIPVFRFVQGAGYSIATTGLSAAVADVVPRHRMGEGIGYFGLGNSISMAVGPAVALALCEGDNYNPVFITATAILVVCMLVVFFLVRYEKDKKFQERKAMEYVPTAGEQAVRAASDTAAAETEYRGAWKFFEKSALKPTFVSLFLSLTSAATVAFLTLYAKKTGIDAAPYYTINGIVLVAARLLFSRAGDRFAPVISLVPAFVVGGIGFLFLALSAQTHILFYIAGGLIGLCLGVAQPILNAESVRYVSANRRGVASATYLMSTDVGIGVGGFFWGLIIDAFGGADAVTSFTPVFFGCILCLCVSILLSLLWLRSKPGQRVK